MTMFGDIFGWLIGSLVDLCREVVIAVWRHPFPYAVVFALLLAIVLWGLVCLRFAPEP